MLVYGQREIGTTEPKWEYATVHVEPFSNWFWSEPGLYVEEEDLRDLCRELGFDSNLPSDPKLSQIINWAGVNGWEMVTMHQEPGTVIAWFKRKRL